MKKITGILTLAMLLGTCVAYGQVAKSFPAGSPVAEKANLVKIYSGIETQLPKWKTEAEAMQPSPYDSYAIGKMVETAQKDLLRTLDDLQKVLEAAKNEDFGNPWEVAFIECRIKDDLEEVSDNFDLYMARLAASSTPKTETGNLITEHLLDIRTYATTSRVLRIDLGNRLRDMAVVAEKKH